MASKRRQQRMAEERESHARWAKRLSAIVLGGAVALVIVSALVPSEAAISDGTYAPLAAGWCVLLVLWASAAWLAPAVSVRLGWTELALAALIGWHSLAALVSLGSANGRQALNALWLFVGYGLTVFLVRQSLRTLEQTRAVLAAMMWLATLLAAFGFYQYTYSMPRMRVLYEADPTQVLSDNQIPIEENSPQREQFENRLRSLEPVATFALTNSLAGVLAPWLVAMAAIALPLFGDRQQRQTLVCLGIVAIVMATCLALTKSRTGYLATALGLVLVVLYGSVGGWRLDWRIPTAVAGVALAIGLAAVYFGGLDAEVLSEAPKSVLYRLEYWQSTVRLISENLLWGCGPGNFQEAYTAYKLPQASESVKDPHNFLLEMWATAGTPGLALLLFVIVGFIADVAAGASSGVASDEAGGQVGAHAVGLGAAMGLLIAAPVATLVDYPLESLGGIPVIWLIGLPLGGAIWWALRGWIEKGSVTIAAVVIPQVVVLVNLLAAGALTFPGVMASMLILMPAACFVGSRREVSPSPAGVPGKKRTFTQATAISRPRVGMIWVGAVVLAAACLMTEYVPVMYGRLGVARSFYAVQTGDTQEAERRALEASQADRLSPEPWRILAELRLSKWLVTGEKHDREAFDSAANEFRRRDPRHHAAFWGRGNWYLTAWRKSGLNEDLSEALTAYTQASIRYPNRALYHAQLAWVLHLAEKEDLACQAAQQAKDLDDVMPHRELKLDRQKIIDPQLAPEGGFKLPREETAEQTVERLRKTTAEDQP